MTVPYTLVNSQTDFEYDTDDIVNNLLVAFNICKSVVDIPYTTGGDPDTWQTHDITDDNHATVVAALCSKILVEAANHHKEGTVPKDPIELFTIKMERMLINPKKQMSFNYNVNKATKHWRDV